MACRLWGKFRTRYLTASVLTYRFVQVVCGMIATVGLVSSWGVGVAVNVAIVRYIWTDVHSQAFQEYYQEVVLPDQSASNM